MEGLIVEHPDFQFKGYKVRVLSNMSLDLVATLNRLVDVYNMRDPVGNDMSFRQFVVFVSCDLLYPVQVFVTDSKEN